MLTVLLASDGLKLVIAMMLMLTLFCCNGRHVVDLIYILFFSLRWQRSASSTHCVDQPVVRLQSFYSVVVDFVVDLRPLKNSILDVVGHNDVVCCSIDPRHTYDDVNRPC